MSRGTINQHFLATILNVVAVLNVGLAASQIEQISQEQVLLRLRVAESSNSYRMGAVAISPDGLKIAAGCDRAFKVWNATDGRELLSMAVPVYSSVAFSPDGKLIAMGLYESRPGEATKSTLLLINSIDGTEVAKTSVETNFPISHLTFSRDGTRVAFASQHLVVIWEYANGRQWKHVSTPTEIYSNSIFCLEFTASNEILSIATLNKIHNLDLTSDARVVNEYSPSNIVGGFSYSQDCKQMLVAGFSDKHNTGHNFASLKILDAEDGSIVRDFDMVTLDNAELIRPCFIDDFAIVIFRSDDANMGIAVWDTKRGDLIHVRNFRKPRPSESPFIANAICENGKLFASFSDGEVVVENVLPQRGLVGTSLKLDETTVFQAIRKRGGMVDVLTHANQPEVHVHLGGNCTTGNLTSLEFVKNLTKLTLIDRFPNQSIAELKRLKNLTALHLVGNSTPATALDDNGLVHLRELSNLKSISLTRQDFTDLGMKELCRIPTLTSIKLHSTKVSGKGINELSQLAELQSLFVSSSSGDIAFSEGFKNLKTLHLEYYKISKKTLLELAQLQKLEILHLMQSGITDADLADLKALPNLKELSLQEFQITDSGLAAIGGLNLNTLKLYRNVTDSSIDVIKDMKNLKELFICEAEIGDDGIKKLGEMTNLKTLGIQGKFDMNAFLKTIRKLKNLSTLKFGGSRNLTFQGMSYLADFEQLTTLEIYVPFPDRTEPMVVLDSELNRELLRIESFKKLTKIQSLGIHGRGVTDRILLSLANLPNLRKLEIYEGLNAESLTKLQTALPKLKIEVRHVPIDMSPADE